MIIVRRVIHKKTTSFGLFTPEQLGQTFQCNFAKKVAQNTKQSYRGISDPWDEPFSRKVDPKGNPKMPPSPRLLSPGVDLRGFYSFDRFVKRNAKGKNISPPKVSTGSLAPSVSSGFKTTINSSGIPAPLIGAALGIGVAATAHYFWRKRRSKNGKQIVERVRRK
jgi:hypothetical protein